MATKTVLPKKKKQPEPVWDIATLFPNQGAWSEEEYLALETNRLVEFSEGSLEILPMPTDKHQAIVAALFMLFMALTPKTAGTVRFAPLRMRLWPGKYREPDLMFMKAANDHRRHNDYWEGADLVVEVTSSSVTDRTRDLVTKRREYAQCGIPEYWVVDPQSKLITVLFLEDGDYVEHGRFIAGQTATSAHFPELQIPVDKVFGAA